MTRYGVVLTAVCGLVIGSGTGVHLVHPRRGAVPDAVKTELNLNVRPMRMVNPHGVSKVASIAKAKEPVTQPRPTKRKRIARRSKAARTEARVATYSDLFRQAYSHD